MDWLYYGVMAILRSIALFVFIIFLFMGGVFYCIGYMLLSVSESAIVFALQEEKDAP
jgi:hypothetical protein